jgi:hypothetical protein
MKVNQKAKNCWRLFSGIDKDAKTRVNTETIWRLSLMAVRLASTTGFDVLFTGSLENVDQGIDEAQNCRIHCFGLRC